MLPQDRPPNVHSLWMYLVDEHKYRGSYKSVRKYVRKTFPAPKLRPFRRVETPPGAQMQSDWLEATIDIGEDVPQKLYGFVMTLSHSRKTAVVWSRSMKQLARHHVHNEALKRLGGVAAVNRIDNLKTGVSRGAGPWGEINESYRAYARTMGFHVDPHEPRQPQQKGKAERRVGVVKQLNLRQGFESLAALQRYTDSRIEREARRRPCPVTGKSVAESWAAERQLLRSLPVTLPEPFDLIKQCPVHKDCTIRFEGRTYAVPLEYVYETVEVREREIDLVHIYALLSAWGEKSRKTASRGVQWGVPPKNGYHVAKALRSRFGRAKIASVSAVRQVPFDIVVLILTVIKSRG